MKQLVGVNHLTLTIPGGTSAVVCIDLSGDDPHRLVGVDHQSMWSARLAHWPGMQEMRVRFPLYAQYFPIFMTLMTQTDIGQKNAVISPARIKAGARPIKLVTAPVQ